MRGSQVAQRTWQIMDFQINLTKENESSPMILADIETGAWEPVKISGFEKWKIGADNGQKILYSRGGTGLDPSSENWFVTKDLNAKH